MNTKKYIAPEIEVIETICEGMLTYTGVSYDSNNWGDGGHGYPTI